MSARTRVCPFCLAPDSIRQNRARFTCAHCALDVTVTDHAGEVRVCFASGAFAVFTSEAELLDVGFTGPREAFPALLGPFFTNTIADARAVLSL